jgi:hypothetical protein
MWATEKSNDDKRRRRIAFLLVEEKTMASDDKTGCDPESNFSFAVRDLQQSNVAQKLTLDHVPAKAANENRGFDPYNTSGSFDRKKNWTRVGKR